MKGWVGWIERIGELKIMDWKSHAYISLWLGALNCYTRDSPLKRAATSQHCQPEGYLDAGLSNIGNQNTILLYHQEAKLYLIFEYLTMDLKQYMDTQCGTKDQPMQPQLVKSWTYQLCQVGKDFDFEIIYFQNPVGSHLHHLGWTTHDL